MRRCKDEGGYLHEGVHRGPEAQAATDRVSLGVQERRDLLHKLGLRIVAWTGGTRPNLEVKATPEIGGLTLGEADAIAAPTEGGLR